MTLSPNSSFILLEGESGVRLQDNVQLPVRRGNRKPVLARCAGLLDSRRALERERGQHVSENVLRVRAEGCLLGQNDQDISASRESFKLRDLSFLHVREEFRILQDEREVLSAVHLDGRCVGLAVLGHVFSPCVFFFPC